MALNKIFRFTRVIAGLFILFFVAAGLITGGFTMAWFTAESPIFTAARMVTGTVKVEVLETRVNSIPFDLDSGAILWAPGESKEFAWTLQNTGSKAVLLRARPEAVLRAKDDSAWGEGTRFTERGNWATYFTYTLGSGTSSNPAGVRLLASQDREAGHVKVWNDEENLYVKYEGKDQYKLGEMKLAVTSDFNTHFSNTKLLNAGGQPVVGQFPFKHEPASLLGEYTFMIPLAGTYRRGALNGEGYSWSGDVKLYIAAHAEVYGKEIKDVDIVWSEEDCGFVWTKGVPEGENGSEVTWWYYCESIPAGGEVNLCLTGTLPEGATKKGLYAVRLVVEAVQSSHDANRDVWPGSPCGL